MTLSVCLFVSHLGYLLFVICNKNCIKPIVGSQCFHTCCWYSFAHKYIWMICRSRRAWVFFFVLFWFGWTTTNKLKHKFSSWVEKKMTKTQYYKWNIWYFQHGGLNVDCQVTESATVLTFSEYFDGMATVLLINHTDKAMIHFHQK